MPTTPHAQRGDRLYAKAQFRESRTNFTRENSGAILLALSALALYAALNSPAHSAALSVADSMIFTTQDQSLWGPGADPVVHKEFTAKIIDVDTGPDKVGGITEASTSIPNPAYLAWSVAFSACRKIYSSSTCTNGGTINLGFTKIRIKGLGSAPPTTLAVSLGKNGLELTYDIDVEAGFKGQFTLDGGKVDVTYPTMATLRTDRDQYAAGELVTLNTFETMTGIPTMSTEFSDVDTSLSAFASLDVKADVEAYVASAGGKVNVVDINTGLLEQELIGLSVGNSEIGLRLFGKAPLVLDTTGGIGVTVYSVDYPPGSIFAIPLGDFQLQVPDLDTGPADSTWDGAKITNTQLPIDRTQGSEDDLTLIGGGVGFHRTDLAKADVDVDGLLSALTLSTATPVVLGLKTGVTGVLTLEGNLIDFDLGAFFGFGQTMTFEPTLMADLNFSSPVMLEIAPGVFESLSSFRTHVGNSLNFLHPGIDLEITPTYFLNNLFSNETNFLISPVASLAVLQLKLSGLVASIAGIDFDAALFQQVFPLFDPFVAATIGSADPFALEGFEPFEGSRFLLTAAVASVPEPPALALLSIGLISAIAFGRRRRQRGW